jgi:uncharacterized protein YjdB
MKHFTLWKSFLSLLVLLVGGLGSAWGETADINIGKNPSNSSSTNYLTSVQTFTVSGVEFKMNNYNPNSGQVRGNQNTVSNNFYLYNNSALPGNLVSVELLSPKNTSDSKIYIRTGNSVISKIDASGTNPSSGKWTGLSGKYFCISFGNGATSGTATISGIKITYTVPDGSKATTTTLNETEWTFNLAEGNTPKALTAIVTNNEDDSEVDGATVTWESSDDEVATVDDDGNVTPVAEGTATITASYAGIAATWAASQASCAVTVENYHTTIALGTDGTLSFTDFSPLTTTLNSTKDIDFTGSDDEKYRWSTNNAKKSSTSLQLGTTTGYFKFQTVTSTYGYVVNITYTHAGDGKLSLNDGTTTKTIENNTDFVVANASAPLNILNQSSNTQTITSITITAAKLTAPTITLAGGTYKTAQSTTITTDVVGGQIYYTTDGADPTAGTGTLYSSAVAINNGMTLKAAVKLGSDWGYVSEATYVIKPDAPTFGTEAGNFYDDFNLTMTADDGLTIRYTTDGNEPTSSSTAYTTGVAITGTTTVKAKAFDAYNNASDMVSATYTKIKRDQELAFANTSYIVNLDKTITVTAAHSAGDGAVTYSSANEAIATVNETTGVITPVAEGTVTITATAAETTGYYEKTATYTLNVYPAGTVLKETFASSLGDFTDDGNGAWTYSTYARGTTYSTQLNAGSYAMVSPEFDLTGMQSALLSFDHAATYFNATNGTYVPGTSARIYAKKVGDAEWTEVAINNDFTASEANNNKAVGSATWKTSSNQNLSDFVGGKAQIKFVITSSIDKKGGNWFIKNLLITASEDKYYEAPTLTFENDAETMVIDDVKTVTATTNSDQTITYASDDTDIATVDAETGEVTAKAAGTAHITASVARNAKWEAAEVSYTLTVNKKTATMSFDPTSLTIKTVSGAVSETLPTLTVTPAAESLVRYSSSDTETATVNATTGAVTAVKAGTVTITAAISDNDVWNDVSVSYTLTLGYSDAGVAFANDEYEVTYGEDFESPVASKTTTAALTYTSENPAVASVNAETGEVTIHAVGVTIITASAAEENPYNAGEAEYLLTVNELTTFPTANSTLLEEHFTNMTSTSGSNITTAKCDYKGWTAINKVFGNTGYVWIASSGGAGSMSTGTLTGLRAGATISLSAKGNSAGNVLTLTPTGCTLDKTTITTTASWDTYTVNVTAVTGTPSITLSAASGKQVNIDDIVISQTVATVPVTVAASKEWVTYCSPYVLDFTNDVDDLEGAYYINGHEDGSKALTVTKVTGKVPAKTGLLLHVTPAAEAQTIDIPVGDTGTALSGNKLVGVLSPTYIYPTDGSYTNLGLSGGNFVGFNNPGVIGANKAYLQILTSEMPETDGDAKLTIVFDNGETTGIDSLRATLLGTDGIVYDITGRKVADKFNNQLPRGLYIINGKKYVVK